MREFRELNEKFYELYGRLYENKNFLTKKQLDYISSGLLEQYQIEFKKLYLSKDLDDRTVLFKLKKYRRRKKPFAFLFFSNKIARILSKNIKKEVSSYFEDLKS